MIILRQKQYTRAFEESLKGLPKRKVKLLRSIRKGRAWRLRDLREQETYLNKLWPQEAEETSKIIKGKAQSDLGRREILLKLTGVKDDLIGKTLNQKKVPKLGDVII